MDQAPLPPAPPLGKSMIDIFSAPSEIFTGLHKTEAKPTLWAIPLIFSIVIGVLIVIAINTNEVLKAQRIEIARQAIEQRVADGKMTSEQADQALTQMEKNEGFIFVMQIIGVIIILTIFFFLAPLFLWLANKICLKSTAGYGKHLEMYGITTWIGVLGGIITIFMMVGLNSIFAQPSLAIFILNNLDIKNSLHKLLTTINFFGIWSTVLVGIGLGKLSEKSSSAGLGVAFGLWIIWIIIQNLLNITM